MYNGHKEELMASVREMVAAGYDLPISKAQFRRYVAARNRGRSASAALSEDQTRRQPAARTAGVSTTPATEGSTETCS